MRVWLHIDCCASWEFLSWETGMDHSPSKSEEWMGTWVLSPIRMWKSISDRLQEPSKVDRRASVVRHPGRGKKVNRVKCEEDGDVSRG